MSPGALPPRIIEALAAFVGVVAVLFGLGSCERAAREQAVWRERARVAEARGDTARRDLQRAKVVIAQTTARAERAERVATAATQRADSLRRRVVPRGRDTVLVDGVPHRVHPDIVTRIETADADARAARQEAFAWKLATQAEQRGRLAAERLAASYLAQLEAERRAHGEACRILWVVSCPTRTQAAIGGVVLGAVGTGALLLGRAGQQ